MIPRRSWINRRSFRSRNGLILMWLFLGHFLVMGYKSLLLSTLIPIRYESTIDTLDEMVKSGLPFVIPSRTTFHKLIASDPRPSMKEIYKRIHLVPYKLLLTSLVKGSELDSM